MFDADAAHRLLDEGLLRLESAGREAAARVFERAFELAPEPRRLREFAEAIRAALATRGSPRDPRATSALDSFHRFQDEGQSDRALSVLEDLVADPACDPTILVEAAKGFVQLGETQRAREPLVRACERDATCASALAGLAGIETREGRHDRALDLARRALNLDPFEPEAYRALLISSALSGDESTAREHAARCRLVVGDEGFVSRLCDEAARRRRAADVHFEGGDGRDSVHAIRLFGAASSEVRQCAERLYAERTLGQEWDIEGQDVIEEGERVVDCLVLQRGSETRKLYFDVTGLECVGDWRLPE